MGIPTKFPTFIGIILLLLVVGTIIFFSERALRTPSRASGSEAPQNVRITNISDSSFTVTWTTQLPVTGTLLVSYPGKSNRLYYDERDSADKTLHSYTAHSISIRDAHAGTPYSIYILTNGRKHDEMLTLTTPDVLAPNTNSLEPAYGTVQTPASLPAEGALVYLTIEGGQELSAITKPSGLWLIPLNQVRTGDFTSYLPTYERMTESIVVRHNELEIKAMSDTLNDSPVPDMKLGETYDFRRQNAKTPGAKLALRPATPTPASNTTESQLPIGGSVLGNTTTTTKVALQTPTEGAAITTTLPLFSGTGVPNKFIGLSIGIKNPQSGSTKIRSDGVWNYTPTRPLAAGKQSVTISTVDPAGRPVAITHTFQIMKSGTQVLGDATPSATLTPSATGAATPTPTETPVDIPTSTLAGQEVPRSGNELPTIMFLLLGLALLGSGAVVFAR